MIKSFGNADRRRGAAALEFAVCAPVLLTFVFGIIEFARAVQLQQSVRQAAFEGARAGAALDANESDALAAATADLAAVGIADAAITVTPNPLLYDSPTVTVTASARPATSGWLLRFFNRSSRISGSITLLREVQWISAPGAALSGSASPPVVGGGLGGPGNGESEDDHSGENGSEDGQHSGSGSGRPSRGDE